MLETMRPRQAIEAQHRAALDEADRCSDDADRAQGVAAALSWILGSDDVAPCSGRPALNPTSAQVADEASFSEDILYSRRPAPTLRSRSWVGGVEHALIWTLGRSPMTPIDTDEPELRTQTELAAELIDLRAKAGNPVLGPDDRQRLEGASDAVAWVLGERVTAPLSGHTFDAVPDFEAIEDEADLANLLRSPDGPPPAGVPEVNRFYAAGVDSALRWVENGSTRSV